MKKNYFLIPLITIIVAIVWSLFTNMGMVRYATLHLPSWTPSWAFIGMVWTLIFICTMISALLFRNKFPRKQHFTTIARLFVINAALNLLRSFIFFTHHLLVVGLVEMIILWLVTLAMFILLLRKAKLAAWLLVPYLVRVIIATTLACNIVIMN